MNIYIKKAKYIEGYKIELTFMDNTIQTIDFEKTVKSLKVPAYKKYQDLKHFKKFKIEMGNIVWGKNWDLVFPEWDLYHGKVG